MTTSQYLINLGVLTYIPVANLGTHPVRRPGPSAREERTDAGLTVYRAAQEALTNRAKHAGRGSCSELRLTWGAEEVELVARPLPRGGASRPAVQWLRPVRPCERAELAGGRLAAGPTEDGFELRVTLPYEHEKELG